MRDYNTTALPDQSALLFREGTLAALLHCQSMTKTLVRLDHRAGVTWEAACDPWRTPETDVEPSEWLIAGLVPKRS